MTDLETTFLPQKSEVNFKLEQRGISQDESDIIYKSQVKTQLPNGRNAVCFDFPGACISARLQKAAEQKSEYCEVKNMIQQEIAAMRQAYEWKTENSPDSITLMGYSRAYHPTLEELMPICGENWTHGDSQIPWKNQDKLFGDLQREKAQAWKS